jgi:AmpE protein
MMLIAILFCLAFQRFTNIGRLLQPTWFVSYLKLLSPWLARLEEHLVVLVTIAPILLSLALLHIMGIVYSSSLFKLFLSIVVLLCCLDTRDLKFQLTSYFDNLDKNNEHAAAEAVSDFIDAETVGNNKELKRAVSKAILTKSLEVFVGLFWFMTLKIYGIAIYFLVVLLRDHALKANSDYVEIAKLANKIEEILSWLPARLLGLSYALVGDFNRGISYLAHNMWSGLSQVKDFAIAVGLAALSINGNASDADKQENLAVLNIVNRALIIWLLSATLVTGVMLLSIF